MWTLMVTARLLQGLWMMVSKPGHYAKVAQALRTLTSLMLCQNEETFNQTGFAILIIP